jgi:hypothetical protein
MAHKPETSRPVGQPRIDSGQRIAAETRIVRSHDGKEAVRFTRPVHGKLPADIAGGRGPAPATVEDVVESAPSASVWEARDDNPATPRRRGRDPASTRDKEPRKR